VSIWLRGRKLYARSLPRPGLQHAAAQLVQRCDSFACIRPDRHLQCGHLPVLIAKCRMHVSERRVYDRSVCHRDMRIPGRSDVRGYANTAHTAWSRYVQRRRVQLFAARYAMPFRLQCGSLQRGPLQQAELYDAASSNLSEHDHIAQLRRAGDMQCRRLHIH
jgi:hypothetical protein